MVEDKAELASLLEAEKSRRRLLEQQFSTAQEEADRLRYMLAPLPGEAIALFLILVAFFVPATSVRLLMTSRSIEGIGKGGSGKSAFAGAYWPSGKS